MNNKIITKNAKLNLEKNKEKFIESLQAELKNLWGKYHIAKSIEKKILKKNIEVLQAEIRNYTVIISYHPNTSDFLSEKKFNETFFIITKNMKKKINNESFLKIQKGIYSSKDFSKSSHRDFIKNIINEQNKEINLEERYLYEFAEDISTSKYYFSGMYNEEEFSAYIWDFPTKEIEKELKKGYKDLKQIFY